MTITLDKRVKYHGISEEEHDFTIMAEHILHQGIDVLKSCFFTLTTWDFLLFSKITVVVSD